MPLLELEQLSRSFGGVRAVNDVSFAVSEGEILALIGPNGSGKSTLFNLISGLCRPDAGRIHFDGKDITAKAPYKICQAGIGRTFQLVRPFKQMTPLENVMVGRAYGSSPTRSGAKARVEAEEILSFTGLVEKRVAQAGSLNLVDRKRLEIARALATKPKMLLLDETMAGLNQTEVGEAIALVKRIRDSGITLIVVEHIMRVVFGISDRVIVLDGGRQIAEGTPLQIAANERVIAAYLGAESDA
jgi:branched-chain amino acid transport system ATP-binding protein